MLRLTAVFALVSTAALAEAPDVAWRFDLGGPALSHPAVSSSGLIAVAIDDAVVVLDADGKLVKRVENTVSAQPMWDGDALWVRTSTGWVRHAEALSKPCAAGASNVTLTANGELLWAPARSLRTCDRVLAGRKGRAGQVVVLAHGYATADEWWLELFDASFKPVAQLRVDEVGSPAGVDAKGRLLVTAPDGRLRTIDAQGHVIWKGPAGDDGPPLVTSKGLLVLGGRSLSLLGEKPWSLPIAAGVRQAAVLEGGAIAVLERSGRLGLVRDGQPVWARRLLEPGQLFGAHPSGLLLVQEGQFLVAWRAPPPDEDAPVPVLRGLDRTGRWPREPAPVLENGPCADRACTREGRVIDLMLGRR